MLRGVDPSLRSSRAPRVRVRIALRTSPVNRTLATAPYRAQLRGTLKARDQRLLRRDPASGPLIARRNEAARARALRRLSGRVRSAAVLQRPAWLAIERAGGRVLESDPVSNALVAELPHGVITAIARRRDVYSVEAAPVHRRLATGLGLSSAAVGAPSFWTAGFTGGTGPNDASSIDVSIISDKMQHDHPAFAGIAFQTPSNATSASDHGTAVGSIAVSRGASGCGECVPADAEMKGVAPGVDSVLDASPQYGNGILWSLGVTQSLNTDGDVLPGAADPAEVINNSGGTLATADDSSSLQNLDYFVSTFGFAYALPAGNTGPAQSMHSGCIAYNSLCMGAYRHMGTESPVDDVMADFSSRGPSPGGRKKPDLVAIGVTMYAERRWADAAKPLWSGSMDGTSWAAPQAAGAAALLAGSGISDPALQKAILINSSRLGRATPSDPMGTQSGWQPDWAWGALDLDRALTERTHGVASSVPGGSARFYRATGVSAADRATVVWHRRANLTCEPLTCPPIPMTLTNLDLQQLDPATGAVQAQSNSAIDNVEQIRSPGAAATAIYKVKATSSVDGLAAEPFAVTAARPLTPLATPQPAVTLDIAAGTQRTGETATVTATVRNPSADLTAEEASVTLQLPAGVEIVSGAQTRSLGTLATSSPTQTFTWAVKGTSDGIKALTAQAQASRYGETFTSSATDSFTVDATPPAPTIAAPQGTTASRSLAVTWGASDSFSSIASYDVEVAVDGGAWSPWITGTTLTRATYTGAVGHRYRFRVRATDSLGNGSEWLESSEATVADPPTTGNPETDLGGGNPGGADPGGGTIATKAKLKVTLRSVKRTRAGVLVQGKVDAKATGGVTVTYTTKVGRKIYRARRYVRVAKGRFKVSLRLPAKARRAKRGTVQIKYRGDSSFAPLTITRGVRSK